MAQAAVLAAGLNVKINAASLKDQAKADDYRKKIEKIENAVQEITRDLLAVTAERGGF